MIRLLALLAFAGAMSSSTTFDFVDKPTVRSATVYEFNVDAPKCHAILEGGALCATVTRHFDLKPTELDRALALVNDRLHYDAKARPTCAVPRQAIVFETTQGKRAVDIALECNYVGGRAPTPATKFGLSVFLRSFGFVAHVPFMVE